MLLRFGFENLRSFRDRTELSFVATSQQDEPPYTLPAQGTPHGVLPVVALYGANASGKSNVIAAMNFFWGELRSSFQREADAPIPRVPFLLRPEARDACTRLDCDIVLEGVRYHYGFECDDLMIRQEWLYAWATPRRAVLFHRQGANRHEWYFGPSLKGRNSQIADFTRDNCLFLSAAAQHNHPMLGDIVTRLGAQIDVGDAMPAASARFYRKEDPLLQDSHRKMVARMLREADLGIADLRVREPDEAVARLVGTLSSALGEPQGNQGRIHERVMKMLSDDGRKWVVVELGHEAEHGVQFFEEDQESLGTRTLLKLLNPVLRTLADGTCLVLDELGGGLHPRVVAALVGLFTNPASNPRGAQLLFATHDSLYMEQLRRDEVVLVEKDSRGVSTLRSLSDYDIRHRDNWRKGYEMGRFGGVPIVGDLSRALGKS